MFFNQLSLINQRFAPLNSVNKFKLAIVDENAEKIVLKITAKQKKDSEVLSGKLTLDSAEKIEVTCEME